MIVGIPKETFPGERRVAMVPANMAGIVKAGLEIQIEAGAGLAAGRVRWVRSLEAVRPQEGAIWPIRL